MKFLIFTDENTQGKVIMLAGGDPLPIFDDVVILTSGIEDW